MRALGAHLEEVGKHGVHTVLLGREEQAVHGRQVDISGGVDQAVRDEGERLAMSVREGLLVALTGRAQCVVVLESERLLEVMHSTREGGVGQLGAAYAESDQLGVLHPICPEGKASVLARGIGGYQRMGEARHGSTHVGASQAPPLDHRAPEGYESFNDRHHS
jgi:hypothetical protein